MQGLKRALSELSKCINKEKKALTSEVKDAKLTKLVASCDETMQAQITCAIDFLSTHHWGFRDAMCVSSGIVIQYSGPRREIKITQQSNLSKEVIRVLSEHCLAAAQQKQRQLAIAVNHLADSGLEAMQVLQVDEAPEVAPLPPGEHAPDVPQPLLVEPHPVPIHPHAALFAVAEQEAVMKIENEQVDEHPEGKELPQPIAPPPEPHPAPQHPPHHLQQSLTFYNATVTSSRNKLKPTYLVRHQRRREKQRPSRPA